MLRYSNESINDYNSVYSADFGTTASRPIITITYNMYAQPIQSGTYYIKNAWQGKYLECVNPESGYTAGRTIAGAFNGGNTQHWKVTKNSDGTYGLSPVSRPDCYLEVFNQVNANKRPITTYSWSPTVSGAKWLIITNNDGTFSIRPV